MKKSSAENDVADMLHRSGIRPSVPRRAVLQYLIDHKIHPTADRIFTEISPFYPTLSKTTVYNTLKLLDKHGLVKTLFIDKNESRYEADIGFHAHFKCRCCGGVFDLPSDFFTAFHQPDHNWKTETVHLDFYGVCPSCSQNTEK